MSRRSQIPDDIVSKVSLKTPISRKSLAAELGIEREPSASTLALQKGGKRVFEGFPGSRVCLPGASKFWIFIETRYMPEAEDPDAGERRSRKRVGRRAVDYQEKSARPSRKHSPKTKRFQATWRSAAPIL